MKRKRKNPEEIDQEVWKTLSPGQKKHIFLEMARRGEPRPHHCTTVGMTLKNYIAPASESYDKKFVSNLRDACKIGGNDWFAVSDKRDSEGKKQLLLEMAKRGEPRPKFHTELGINLISYTSPSNGCYDKGFVSNLRDACKIGGNDWFANADKMDSEGKKQLLLEMAKRGEPRPQKTLLGKNLVSYTSPNSESYDKEFVSNLRDACKIGGNDWFAIGDSRKPKEKKELLIEMAKRGEPRPQQKTLLGKSLMSYIGPSGVSYDKEFVSNLRDACKIGGNDWFEKSTAIWQSLIDDIEYRLETGIALNERQIHRLKACLLDRTDPYFSPNFYRNYGDAAKEYLANLEKKKQNPKRRNPEKVDPSFWTNFVLNALSGRNPDQYFKEHEYHIMTVANYLRSKFGFPVDNTVCWRGLMVPQNLASKKDLAAWEHTSFVSFSENKEIALLFGDVKHNISRFFAVKHPDYVGILCKEMLKAEEVIFHWQWFFKTPLHQMMPDWSGIVNEQKEIMVKNMKRPLQIEMKINPGSTQSLWWKYPYTSSTS